MGESLFVCLSVSDRIKTAQAGFCLTHFLRANRYASLENAMWISRENKTIKRGVPNQRNAAL
jgi:hypothetical protein